MGYVSVQLKKNDRRSSPRLLRRALATPDADLEVIGVDSWVILIVEALIRTPNIGTVSAHRKRIPDINQLSSNGLPKLSIIVATTQPWPEIRGCLESLEVQAKNTGAEVLVADGNGEGLSADLRTDGNIRYFYKPGASVFQLRAMAMEHARAEIIAVTEDHCRVAPDWCEKIIAAHARHPEVAVIGGVVENGAINNLVDWAHFLVANAPYMSPLKVGFTDKVALQANISYKRYALPMSFSKQGLMEMLYNQEISKRGLRLYADDSVVVEHIQSLGFIGSCAINFHNGRSIAGYRLEIMGSFERWLRLIGCAVLPPYMLLRTWCTLIAKRRSLFFGLAVTLYLIALLICHAAGEVLGYIKGSGESPKRIR